MNLMMRIPFPVLVAAMTGLAAVMSIIIRPGRPDVLIGSVLGTAVAGAFAATAVAMLKRARLRGGPNAGLRMVNVFVGLMAARMLGYVALILAAVFLGAGEPISVCIGLVGGTMVFQVLEVAHLRKMT